MLAGSDILMKHDSCIEILTADFLIDKKFNPWLLNVNNRPSLSTNCLVKKEVVPKMINDLLTLVMKIHDSYGEYLCQLETIEPG